MKRNKVDKLLVGTYDLATGTDGDWPKMWNGIYRVFLFIYN